MKYFHCSVTASLVLGGSFLETSNCIMSIPVELRGQKHKIPCLPANSGCVLSFVFMLSNQEQRKDWSSVMKENEKRGQKE